MRTKNTSRRSHVAQTTKYVWVAAATLIAAVILGAFVATPHALASSVQDSDQPFGLQSGLVTARGVGYVAPLDLKGGMGLPFGLQSGLVTANLDTSGRVVTAERSAAASYVRNSAIGKYYAAMYGSTAATSSLPHTDVAKFYSEWLRVRASENSALALNPELILARRSYGAAASLLAANPELILARSASAALPYTDVSKFYVERMRVQASQSNALAFNPELILARRSYGAAASLLAANPELLVARGAYVTQSGLAANPELIVARQSYDQGYIACSLNGDELAANPELAYVNEALTC